MVETSKQVRLDNWGIYFLQRLQLFFSKTDYCDLTLQFEGNVQLKVHRLVMNACTEYFAFLEQSYPALEENTIMMPSDLQADVIVPIVNFMYTGMLEFHPSIYKKLYRAAEIMNMVVLIKLLEAQLMPGCKLPNKMKKDRDREPLDAVREPKEFKKQPKPSPPLVNESTSPVPFKKLSSETGTDGQIMSQDEPQIPIQDPENVEGSMSTPVPASSQVAEEASTCLVNQPILKPESLNLEGELLMNAPQNFQSSIHEISENVEPMEVDTEQMPNETLCNTKDEAGVDEIDNTLSNTVDAPNENSQEYLKVNDAEPLKEESVQKLKNNEEANFEQSICAAGADICEENENPVSSENHEHGEPVGENNPNDSNDNLQDSYGAFTEETQRSSTETSQKDLNKEILEDWDDTDSQQSQTQEQQAQDAALINVSENVSELMDDWEEEDEDQTKG
ncbi:hypothetical protein YQE_01701, partial [Dendroctonus ponderosae]